MNIGTTTRYRYNLDVRAVNNYYPFGMLMPDMSWQTSGYRYGFGSHENDNDVKGEGNHSSFGDFGYDPRVGRRLMIEPMISQFPSLSPYVAYADNPVVFTDPDGLDWILFNGKFVIIYGGNPGDRTTPLKIYKGTSGAITVEKSDGELIYKNYQNSANVGLKNLGPVPPGKFNINLKPSPFRYVEIGWENNKPYTKPNIGLQIINWNENINYHGWGLWRARLEPIKGSYMYDRNYFYMHDSYKGYSSGCIETETDLYYDLVNYWYNGYKSIEVWIEYENNTSTYGNTKMNPRPWQVRVNSEGLPEPAKDAFPDKNKLPDNNNATPTDSPPTPNNNSNSGSSSPDGVPQEEYPQQ